MVEIPKAKAKELFAQGKTIIALPSEVSVEHPSFMKLTLHMDFFKGTFPSDRIREYSSHYCNDVNGHDLKFYFEPPRVLISWAGNGFIVRKAENGQILHQGTGKEGALIRYLNSKYLMAINSGFLPPPFRSKLKLAI